MNLTSGPSEHATLRVVLDECVGPDSPLVRRFEGILRPEQRVEFVSIAKVHRAISDSSILTQLLGPDTVLLTVDRVLHNQACELGFRSYTLNERGEIIRKKLPDIPTPNRVPVKGGEVLKADYAHEPNWLATALKTGLDERGLKKYRTRRRRIRSYFGAESNISQVALTVGAKAVRNGAAISGFFLAVAGYSGVKGIRASEGYALAAQDGGDPAHCLIHALRELYLLQIEKIPVELFIIHSDSLALCQQLLSGAALPDQPAIKALSKLLTGLTAARALPCAKGPFFLAMEHKLKELAGAHQSNELVPVDFSSIIESLNNSPGASVGDPSG